MTNQDNACLREVYLEIIFASVSSIANLISPDVRIVFYFAEERMREIVDLQFSIVFLAPI